ncbi:hypothetical protein ABKV19_014115 [Rosa sericea]
MVKNKGFLPSGPSEVSIQRQQIKEIIFSLLPACKEPDPDSKVPFKADAIIANPPAYGHFHVAEALKIPIHIFFTMPWTGRGEAAANTPKRILIKCEMSGGSLLSTHMCTSHEVAHLLLVHFR